MVIGEIMNPTIPQTPPGSVQGIPSGNILPNGVSQDAITQAAVSELQLEVNAQNQFNLNNYHGQLSQWNENNQFGKFEPAPNAITLLIVNPKAAAMFENGQINWSSVIMQTTYYEVPPGLIAQPPAQPTPVPQPTNPVGSLIVGTTNMYNVNPGDTHQNGDVVTQNGVNYVKLVNPFGEAVYMKQ